MKNTVSNLRKLQKISQLNLAKRVGISRPALSAIENGTVPNGDTMLKISNALNKRVEEVFSLDDREKNAS